MENLSINIDSLLLRMLSRKPARICLRRRRTCGLPIWCARVRSVSEHPGDPRLNVQEGKGKAKAYQARQVLRAIKNLGAMK
jgi:hypothetical protein